MTLQKTGSFSDNFLKNIFDRASKPSENDIAEVAVLNPQAQNNAALSFLANRFAEENLKVGNTTKTAARPNPDVIGYKIYVKLPPDKDSVEYEQLEKSVIKTVFDKNGIVLSRAALEEVAAKIKIDFTPAYNAAAQKYVANPGDGLMISPQDLKINGSRARGYELPISSVTEQKILAQTAMAQEVTASGRKAFSELTGEERLKMMVGRTGKYLPKDTARFLQSVDPKMLVAGVMTGAALNAAARRGVVISNGLLLLGGAVSLAQLLKYGGDAQHILDLVAQAKKPEDLDKAAQEMAQLAQNGAIDLLLTAVGYGAGKIAPKISSISGKGAAIASEYADEIAGIAKQKWAEYDAKVKQLGESLLPETEYAGVPKQTGIEEVKGANVYEARAQNGLSGVTKSVNLPAWNKLTFKLDGDGAIHFLSGHKAGGNRLKSSTKGGGNKDVFPEWMSDKQIINAVKEAYNNSRKVKTQTADGETIVKLVGESQGMKIEMYVNVTTKQLETAYPQFGAGK